METNAINVFSECHHMFGNFDENDMNLIEDNIENNLIIRSGDFFADFPALDSRDSSAVYETIDLIESEDNNRSEELLNRSNELKNINEFCVNNCEQIIKRLVADNEELKKFKRQLIAIEELNAELIKDKERLESELKHTKDLFEKKVILKNQTIDDLKKSLYIFESLNSSLQNELEFKRSEKSKLDSYIKETEDKLYFCEMQLMESQTKEEELLSSYSNIKDAFTTEEENKYKTIEQLHNVYVECAQQQNDIKELKQQVSDLSRDIADKDNELWFYKLKFEESFRNCLQTPDRHQSSNYSPIKRESVYVNRTSSEIPEYSFSVNEDDADHIYSDFIDDNPLCDSIESNESQTVSEKATETTNKTSFETNERIEKPLLNRIFCGLINVFAFLVIKFPFKLILSLFLMILSSKLVFGSLLATKLPAYTSWEEIFYRVLLPYITKVKVSQTQ